MRTICSWYFWLKKPWSKCTRKEIELEAWYQLINDRDFINNTCIEDNTKLKDIKIVNFTMWDSYIYKNNKIIRRIILFNWFVFS